MLRISGDVQRLLSAFLTARLSTGSSRIAFAAALVAALAILGWRGDALAQVIMPPVVAPCSSAANVVTCGNVPAGVRLNGGGTPFTVLDVSSTPITPAAGIDGIQFGSSTGSVTINSIISGAGISVTGAAQGIEAFSSAGSVTVNHTGHITTTASDGIFADATGTGSVKVTSTGNLTTGGDNAEGIFARSVSGSIEVVNVGNILAAGTTESDGIVATSTSGTIIISNTGNITTASSGAEGILATTTGNVTITHKGDITTTGSISDAISVVGGAIDITSSGVLKTSTSNSEGIYAEGKGKITVEVSSGSIETTGTNSIGVRAFSTGGDSTVTIKGGVTVTGATGSSGAGVSFVGAASGTNNKLVNEGIVTTIAGLAGVAVRGNLGNETIENKGTILGNIELGAGTNQLINEQAGTFFTGTVVNLGTADPLNNTLTNHGTLSSGPVGGVQTTALTGNIVQTGTGEYIVDVNAAAGTADRINATGTANLAGTVVVNLLTLPVGLNQQFTILTATGGVTDNGLKLSFPNTIVLQGKLSYPVSGTEVVLGITVDYSAAGLNRNQTAIGDHLNASYAAGGGGLNPVLLSLMGIDDLAAYRNALDQLSPEIYNATRIAALYANEDFTSNLMSCRVSGPDAVSIVREGQCLWFGARARFVNVDRTSENIGFDESGGMFSAGAQVALGPAWRVGFGAGYQTTQLDMDTGARSHGDQIHAGAVIKYNPGALLLAAAISGGQGWYDTTRPIALPGFVATAQGDHDVTFLSGRLHASYLFGAPELYWRPMVEAAVTSLGIGGFAETGAGPANLVVGGRSDTVLSVSPAIQFGGQWTMANGVQLRPFVKAGVTWFDGDTLSLDASFAGTPAGVQPFTIRSNIDDFRADLGLGLDVVNGELGAFRIHYDAHLGANTEIHSIGVKGSAKF